MTQRQAVTKRKALTYRGADRVGKSRILYKLVELGMASRLDAGGVAERFNADCREASRRACADLSLARDDS